MRAAAMIAVVVALASAGIAATDFGHGPVAGHRDGVAPAAPATQLGLATKDPHDDVDADAEAKVTTPITDDEACREACNPSMGSCCGTGAGETCCDNESVCDRFGNCCQESVRGFAGRSRFFRYTAMHVAVCVLGAVSDVVRHYGRG